MQSHRDALQSCGRVRRETAYGHGIGGESGERAGGEQEQDRAQSVGRQGDGRGGAWEETAGC
eukprot:12055814-Alexandrium_andersonii.AAC.1